MIEYGPYTMYVYIEKSDFGRYDVFVYREGSNRHTAIVQSLPLKKARLLAQALDKIGIAKYIKL